MLRLKKILSLVLIICSSGCAIKLPKLADQERCIVSFEFQMCRCHMYRISPERVGRVSQSYNRPVEYCEKLIGFRPDSWVDIPNWLQEVFDTVKDANQGKYNTPILEKKEDILEITNEVS